MSSSSEEALEAVARPLRYAARNDFKNLAVLKGLEASLGEALARAKPRIAAEVHRAIAPLIAGIDGAEAAARISRVRKILEVIDGAAPNPVQVPVSITKERRGRKKRSGPEPGPGPGGARIRTAEAEPSTPLSAIVGLGPKTSARLAARGLVTVADLLLFLPRRHDDRRAFTPIARLVAGTNATVRGVVASAGVRFGGRRSYEVSVQDETGVLSCRFFRFSQKAMESRFVAGRSIVVSGVVSLWGSRRQMVHPEVADGEAAMPEGLVPIYGEVEGVPAKTLRKILVELARAAAPKLPDPLPADLRRSLSLPPLHEAVRAAHLPDPEDTSTVEALRRRLVFDELFFLQLALAKRSKNVEVEPGFAHRAAADWRRLADPVLPFSLTGAQSRVMDEIARDLEKPSPMNRLLQGDVGSGKTAVAFLAARIAVASGTQAALLVPTEILATQHAKNAARILAPAGLRIALLTGSTPRSERRGRLADLATGGIDLVIGTHALLEDDVEFQKLGLAIVDEQHRFGVEQRARLRRKGKIEKPDTLVMTATPIPRTLALTVYGDLRVSQIDELPPGRKPTVTHVLSAGMRERAHRIVEGELLRGRQAYVVYPLVEASEKIDLRAATDAEAELAQRFSPHPVALLHGRMSPDEKAEVMARFEGGRVKVLVSTTVIEVGVDVPNATVMLIEHAERFGLSQLHQLRGRVGRGADAGTCVLVAGGGGAEAMERLSVLESCADGFEVAEHDLRQRGPGEMLGTRQAGLPDLVLADLVRDARTLEEAREAAFSLVAEDTGLADELEAELSRRFGGRLGLFDVA